MTGLDSVGEEGTTLAASDRIRVEPVYNVYDNTGRDYLRRRQELTGLDVVGEGGTTLPPSPGGIRV